MAISIPANSWFVGCGAMGGAMVAGWRRVGIDLSGLTAISPSGRKIDGIKVVTGLPSGTASLCFLGFKPQQLANVAPDLAFHVGPETVVISILAGVEVATLRELFPKARAIIRTTPNLPVSEGQGIVAMFGECLGDELRAEIDGLMGALGYAPWCDKEGDIAAIGSISGCGPAFVARFIEALGLAGRSLGLDEELADRLALQTVAGTAALAEATGETMAELARRVASPGGTTEQGLMVLDREDGIRQLVRETVKAARRRSEEMAAAARG